MTLSFVIDYTFKILKLVLYDKDCDNKFIFLSLKKFELKSILINYWLFYSPAIILSIPFWFANDWILSNSKF